MSTALAEPLAAVRRRGRVVTIVVAVLLVLGVVAYLERDQATFRGDLDPRNPQGNGAQALARVLDAHDVQVTVVRGQAALLRQRVDGSTAVAVTDPEQLSPSTLRRLQQHTETAGAVVLVGPAAVLSGLLDEGVGRLPTGRRRAGCPEPLVHGLHARLRGGMGLGAGDGCFGTPSTSALVRRGSTWLLTSPASLSNAHVLEADDAALGLRLLGQEPRLLWYVADAADVPAGDGVRLSRLLPPWLAPSGVLLGVALVGVLLWRGRRLGPLVSEPLPVVVRAAESTESRGRLYRRTGDRQHAATVLTAASRRRIGEALGLPPRTDLAGLVRAAADRTGRDPREVHDLLSTTTVPSPAGLVDLGRRLTELENEVRHP